MSFAKKGYKGVAVGPIPGSRPSTEVYVPVNERVYQINVYAEKPGQDDERLLSSVRFYPPSRSVGSLGLPDANAPEALLYAAGDRGFAERGKYVSLSAHLDSLARGIRQGTKVDRHTVIGLAGDTGGGDIPVGPVHLHQAYYRYPSYNPDGSPYGGAEGGLPPLLPRRRRLHLRLEEGTGDQGQGLPGQLLRSR